MNPLLALPFAIVPSLLEAWVHRSFPKLAARLAFMRAPSLRLPARPKTEERGAGGYREGESVVRSFWPGGPLGGPAVLEGVGVRVEIDASGTSAAVSIWSPEGGRAQQGPTLRLEVSEDAEGLVLKVRSLPTPMVLFTLMPLAFIPGALSGELPPELIGITAVATLVQALIARFFLHRFRDVPRIEAASAEVVRLLSKHLEEVAARERGHTTVHEAPPARVRVELPDDAPAEASDAELDETEEKARRA